MPRSAAIVLSLAVTLTSSFVAAQTPRAANAPEAASSAVVVLHHDQPYVVLAGRVDPSWSAGPVTLVSRVEPVITRRATSRALPATLAAWRRRAVTLHDGQSSRCTGRIGRLYVLNRVFPMSGTIEEWNGDTDHDGDVDGPPLDDAEVARRAFDLSPEASLLVGTLERTRGRCDGTRFALPARAAGPAVLAMEATPGADLRARALAYLRGLPQWAEHQREWEASGDAVPGGHWETDPDTVTDVRSFLDASTGRRVVFVTVDSSPDGCGDMFVGRISALLEVRGDALVPIGAASFDVPIRPWLLLDVAHDGELTLLVHDGRARLDAQGALVQDVTLEIPSLDCPC